MEKKDKASIAAVIAEVNGTYTVLKCKDKEEEEVSFKDSRGRLRLKPKAYTLRSIIARWTGFGTYGEALEFANRIKKT